MLRVLPLVITGCCAASRRSADEQAGLLLERGVELVRAGELERGIETLRELVARVALDSPARVDALRWIGEARERAGDPEGALDEYGLALELAPNDPWLHYASGVSWNRIGELERAVECFSSALALDPRHVKALQWRGSTRRDLGEARGAVDDFTRALECIETGDETTLASWGETRGGLLVETLGLRAEVFEALGEHEAAEGDRGRLAALRGGD